jgi:hypothetical protein
MLSVYVPHSTIGHVDEDPQLIVALEATRAHHFHGEVI